MLTVSRYDRRASRQTLLTVNEDNSALAQCLVDKPASHGEVDEQVCVLHVFHRNS